jgi:hypothetical protein
VTPPLSGANACGHAACPHSGAQIPKPQQVVTAQTWFGGHSAEDVHCWKRLQNVEPQSMQTSPVPSAGPVQKQSMPLPQPGEGHPVFWHAGGGSVVVVDGCGVPAAAAAGVMVWITGLTQTIPPATTDFLMRSRLDSSTRTPPFVPALRSGPDHYPPEPRCWLGRNAVARASVSWACGMTFIAKESR